MNGLVTSSIHRYLIDTDVLVRIRQRPESESIYKEVIEASNSGRVKTVRQVFDELKRFKSVHSTLSPHRSKMLVKAEEQLCQEVQSVIEILGNSAPWLWEQTGGKNPDPADPWLIGVATVHSYTVVTNEGQQKMQRIPAACRQTGVGCRCISGPHFLLEIGIVKEIKPEHVSVEAFFGKSP